MATSDKTKTGGKTTDQQGAARVTAAVIPLRPRAGPAKPTPPAPPRGPGDPGPDPGPSAA